MIIGGKEIKEIIVKDEHGVMRAAITDDGWKPCNADVLLFERADKPTRTNWDALREDKQRVAEMMVNHQGAGTRLEYLYYARFAQTSHMDEQAAIAANLAWLNSPTEMEEGNK